MAAFLSTANWTLCQLGEQNHMQNNNTNEGMSVVNVPINTTAPTNRSREQPQQSTEYPEHSQRGMHSFNAGTPNPFEPLGTTRTPQLNHTRWSSRSPAQVAGMNTSMMQDQMENRYTISTPALLQGIRCFIDASTSPDQPSLMLRQAGLGILIVNTEAPTTQTGYIKTRLTACSSVLMAEAAALALAVNVTHHMKLTNINFLSDCEQLVQFLNAADHSIS